MTDQVSKTSLENGVRVLSERVDGLRSVSVGVLVDVGPKDELPTERGYAHLIEHMLFQGTNGRDARAIAEMIEIGGGGIGAFTASDYTVYHATVLDEYLPFALEVLGDMLCNSTLPQGALECQRAVILQEIAGNDDPVKLVNRLLKRSLWPNHSLGYPTTGLEDTIRGSTRQTLLNFMERHYIARKVVLAAAGNVKHDDFVAQARDNFWQMSDDDGLPPLSPPTITLGRVIAEPRDLRQVYFAMAWPAPAYASPDRYAWHVFCTLFGGGPSSRLYRRLREERGLVYFISAQYQAYGSAGAVVVRGATTPQTLVPVLAGALLELLQMCQEAVNSDDHHRTVQSLISQHLVSGDSVYVRMSRLALQELYFHQAIASDKVIAGLKGQSPEAIRQAAIETFAAGLPTLALVGPVSEELLNAIGKMLSDFGAPPTLIFAPEDAPALSSTQSEASSAERLLERQLYP